MFIVEENGKLCDCNNYNVHSSWSSAKFDTYEKALSYAWRWIAPYGGDYEGKGGIAIPLDTPTEFAEGCFITIRKE